MDGELQSARADDCVEDPEMAGADDNANAGEDDPTMSSVPGTVGFAMHELHKDMRKMLDMQGSIMEKVTRLDTSFQLMPRPQTNLGDYSWECKTCEKVKDISKVPDAELECVVGSYAVTQMVQLFCVIASSSFALQAENGQWIVPEQTTACFSTDQSILKGGSGLAALFFGVKHNLKRVKFASGVGRLWAFLMREAVVEAVKYARDVLFADADSGTEPQWLKYMHDNSKIRKSVAHVYSKLEFQDSRPRSRRSAAGTGSTVPSPGIYGSAATQSRSRGQQSSSASAEEVLARKRRRLESGLPAGSAGTATNVASGAGISPRGNTQSGTGSLGDSGNLSAAASGDDRARTIDERIRREIFKSIRGKHVQYLNAGRTEIRANLYKGVMFLKEFIDFHFDPVKRQDKGFYVPEGATSFQLALPGYEYCFLGDAETELVIPDIIRKDSRWDIPLAETVDEDMCVNILSNKAEGIATNLGTLDKVSSRFPCLTIALRYKREVRSSSGASVPPPDDTEAPGTVWYQEYEKVSLHDVALGILVERFKAQDKASVLCFSPLSIRTVHILAIGILGLLRKSLGIRLTKLEEIALGNAVHEKVNALDDKVSTMLEADNEGGRKKVMRAQSLAEKMVMNTNEYDQRMVRAGGGLAALSAVSQGAASPTSNTDDDSTACARDYNPSWKLGRGRGRGRGV